MRNDLLNYGVWYERLVSRLDQRQRLAKILDRSNRILTSMMYLAYPMVLVNSGVAGRWHSVVLSLVVPGFGFLLVSIWRLLKNQPRPYETWAITPLLKPHRSGCSMPSRHVFSATIIAMTALSENVWLGVGLLGVSVTLGAIRVIGGLHYVKDVLVGFVIGVSLGFIQLALL